MTYGGFDLISVVLLVALLGVAYVKDYLSEEDLDPHSAEGARQAYSTGEISHAELVRRLEVTECPETEKIRNAVEPIKNIGEDTSYMLAQRFDSLAKLRNSEQEELEEIHGIGPSTAKAIRRRFDE